MWKVWILLLRLKETQKTKTTLHISKWGTAPSSLQCSDTLARIRHGRRLVKVSSMSETNTQNKQTQKEHTQVWMLTVLHPVLASEVHQCKHFISFFFFPSHIQSKGPDPFIHYFHHTTFLSFNIKERPWGWCEVVFWTSSSGYVPFFFFWSPLSPGSAQTESWCPAAWTCRYQTSAKTTAVRRTFQHRTQTRQNRRDAGLTACLLRRSCSLCRASSRSRDTGERVKTGCVFRGDTGICSSTTLGPSNIASVQKFASRIGCAFISALHWMGELEERAKNKKQHPQNYRLQGV